MVLFCSFDRFPNPGIFLLIYYAFGTHVYIDGMIWRAITFEYTSQAELAQISIFVNIKD